MRRFKNNKPEVTETSADGDKNEKAVKGLAAVKNMKLTMSREEDGINMRVECVRYRWIMNNVI